MATLRYCLKKLMTESPYLLAKKVVSRTSALIKSTIARKRDVVKGTYCTNQPFTPRLKKEVAFSSLDHPVKDSCKKQEVNHGV